MISKQNQGSKESLAVKFKKRIYAKLCLKVWFKSGWYFCNITKSGWFWKGLITSLSHFRSSRTQMFFKIVVLRNFAIFTGKHQKFRNIHRKTCVGVLFLKICRPYALQLYLRETSLQVFLANIAIFLRIRAAFFKEHPRCCFC